MEYIGTIHEAQHVIDNEHLRGRHRINYDTPGRSSEHCSCYCQSVNVWTHLFAAVAVLAVIANTMMHINPYVTVGPQTIAQ